MPIAATHHRQHSRCRAERQRATPRPPPYGTCLPEGGGETLATGRCLFMVSSSIMPGHHVRRCPLVSANARHSSGYGCLCGSIAHPFLGCAATLDSLSSFWGVERLARGRAMLPGRAVHGIDLCPGAVRLACTLAYSAWLPRPVPQWEAALVERGPARSDEGHVRCPNASGVRCVPNAPPIPLPPRAMPVVHPALPGRRPLSCPACGEPKRCMARLSKVRAVLVSHALRRYRCADVAGGWEGLLARTAATSAAPPPPKPGQPRGRSHAFASC